MTNHNRRAHMIGRSALTLLIASAICLVCGGAYAAVPSDGSAEPNAQRQEVGEGPIVLRTEVSPIHAALADCVRLTVSIDYAPNVQTTLPAFPQQMGHFRVVDIETDSPKTEEGRTTLSQTLTLEPMKTGRLEVFPVYVDYAMREEDGTVGEPQSLATESVFVEVGTIVTDEKGSLEGLRDAAAPVTISDPVTRYVWLAAAATAVLALAAILFAVSRRHVQTPVARVLSPEEIAMNELTALRASGLVQTDVKAYYVELTAIVRRYIEAVTGIRAPERTTEEFLRQITREQTFPQDTTMRLQYFLESADLVKFAGKQPREEDIEESFTRAETFIGSLRLALPEPDAVQLV